MNDQAENTAPQNLGIRYNALMVAIDAGRFADQPVDLDKAIANATKIENFLKGTDTVFPPSPGVAQSNLQ